ncbi:MAG TPA: chlorite dismutase family protein [Ardenticatenaceae bacterium]|nr:chlorite dismutase family protein [Ardenticatenaceae bacterium]
MAERTLNHFAFFTFDPSYWSLSPDERAALHSQWLAGLREAAPRVDIYQVYPGRADTDVMVWSALPADEGCDAAAFFGRFAAATNPHRHMVRPTQTLWGFTRPSIYSKGRSPQEIDPFALERKPYLIVYPFVKTSEWYAMSRDTRQGMMNQHIRIGHEYSEIKQLLLYSFGLQDQEFVVVYETDDLPQFSALVNDLRSTEGRRFTERDTPTYTAVYHPAEETLALWR